MKKLLRILTIPWHFNDNSIIFINYYGNEIVTLVKEEKPVGSFEVEFDATSLTSGIYFYKLQAGSFVETKKMVLMK